MLVSILLVFSEMSVSQVHIFVYKRIIVYALSFDRLLYFTSFTSVFIVICLHPQNPFFL